MPGEDEVLLKLGIDQEAAKSSARDAAAGMIKQFETLAASGSAGVGGGMGPSVGPMALPQQFDRMFRLMERQFATLSKIEKLMESQGKVIEKQASVIERQGRTAPSGGADNGEEELRRARRRQAPRWASTAMSGVDAVRGMERAGFSTSSMIEGAGGLVGSIGSQIGGSAGILGQIVGKGMEIVGETVKRKENAQDLIYQAWQAGGNVARQRMQTLFSLSHESGGLGETSVKDMALSPEEVLRGVSNYARTGLGGKGDPMQAMRLQAIYGVGTESSTGMMGSLMKAGVGEREVSMRAIGTAIGTSLAQNLDRGRFGETFDQIGQVARQTIGGALNLQATAERLAFIGQLDKEHPGRFGGVTPAGQAMESMIQDLGTGKGTEFAKLMAYRAAGVGTAGGPGILEAEMMMSRGVDKAGGISSKALGQQYLAMGNVRSAWDSGDEKRKIQAATMVAMYTGQAPSAVYDWIEGEYQRSQGRIEKPKDAYTMEAQLRQERLDPNAKTKRERVSEKYRTFGDVRSPDYKSGYERSQDQEAQTEAARAGANTAWDSMEQTRREAQSTTGGAGSRDDSEFGAGYHTGARSLNTLTPETEKNVREIIAEAKAAGVDVRVGQTYQNPETARRMFAKGKSGADPSKGRYNYHMAGRAVDLYPIGPDGKIMTHVTKENRAQWEVIWAAARKRGMYAYADKVTLPGGVKDPGHAESRIKGRAGPTREDIVSAGYEDPMAAPRPAPHAAPPSTGDTAAPVDETPAAGDADVPVLAPPGKKAPQLSQQKSVIRVELAVFDGRVTLHRASQEAMPSPATNQLYVTNVPVGG